jgi:hypothetical protein
VGVLGARVERQWARRPRLRAGRVLARPREAVGRLWRGQGGRHRAGKKITGRGPWVQNLVLPPLLLAWVGAGGAGVDRGDAKEHGYSAWAS